MIQWLTDIQELKMNLEQIEKEEFWSLYAEEIYEQLV
jgi:hypothetical protein